jgi:hypothetical protein
MQKPRDRPLRDRHLLGGQHRLELSQRDIRLLRYQVPDQFLVRRQRISLIRPEFGRTDAFRGGASGSLRQSSCSLPVAPQFRGSSRHPALPQLRVHVDPLNAASPPHTGLPSSTILESDSCRRGNPSRLILFGKCSNSPISARGPDQKLVRHVVSSHRKSRQTLYSLRIARARGLPTRLGRPEHGCHKRNIQNRPW